MGDTNGVEVLRLPTNGDDGWTAEDLDKVAANTVEVPVYDYRLRVGRPYSGPALIGKATNFRREGNSVVCDLSFVVPEPENLIKTVEMWPKEYTITQVGLLSLKPVARYQAYSNHAEEEGEDGRDAVVDPDAPQVVEVRLGEGDSVRHA